MPPLNYFDTDKLLLFSTDIYLSCYTRRRGKNYTKSIGNGVKILNFLDV